MTKKPIFTIIGKMIGDRNSWLVQCIEDHGHNRTVKDVAEFFLSKTDAEFFVEAVKDKIGEDRLRQMNDCIIPPADGLMHQIDKD